MKISEWQAAVYNGDYKVKCENCGNISQVASPYCSHCGARMSYCGKLAGTASENITNGDRIRSMSDEELAKFLENIAIGCGHDECGMCPFYAIDCSLTGVKEWLGEKVEE